MPSIFSKIIAGEVPGTFVWADQVCVAFMSIAPLRPGHTLVVPRRETDHWLDLDDPTLSHVMGAARAIGRAIQRAFDPTKVGMMIAGLEVPHVHVHVTPIDGVHDLDFGNANHQASPDDIGQAANRIREALTELGYQEVSNAP